MVDPRTRSQAKADAQAKLDAADAALASGEIAEDDWQRRRADALAVIYLRETDPRWQSGFDGDAALWREARELVLDAVPGDGSLLDVGCATGHLMESLVAWGRERGIRLVVAGLELNRALAAEARRRHPEWASRIYTGNVSDWQPPERYTYVRTGLEYVAPGSRATLVRRLLQEAVTRFGRLIVGPVYEGDVEETVAVFHEAGVSEAQVIRRADRNGKMRAVVWASPGELHAPDA